MGEAVSVESPLPWEAQRPDTLVIACSDGRYRAHVEHFVREKLGGTEDVDYILVPGGIEPLTLLDLIPKDFNFLKRRLEALVATHGTRRVIAIAHQDCGWYRARKLGPFKVDLRERQTADLRRAASWLRGVFPDLVVETYFARHASGPDRVIFDAV